MTREERDRAIADIRARLELDVRTARGFDLPSSIRWYEGKLAALDALIASERQAMADAVALRDARFINSSRNISAEQAERVNSYAHELAGGDGG